MLDDYDITGKVGPLYGREPPEWPMYSFCRPADILWNAIGARLTQRGWSETRVKEWLQSKEARWALDGALGDALEELGRKYADTVK